MPSAQANLAKAKQMLAAQAAVNAAVGTRLTDHNARIVGLRTDVDDTAAVVAANICLAFAKCTCAEGIMPPFLVVFSG